MRPRTLAGLPAVILLVAGVAAAQSVDARAPPTPICGVCDLDRTTADGTTVAAAESSLTVTIYGNGTTAWAAKVDLAAGGDALSANRSLRRAVVADGVRGGIAEPDANDSRADGETLFVEYRGVTRPVRPVAL